MVLTPLSPPSLSHTSLIRPKKIPLESGMKIVRSEYNRLLEHGCDIEVPQKAPAAAAKVADAS